jgi:hypothetical protein
MQRYLLIKPDVAVMYESANELELTLLSESLSNFELLFVKWLLFNLLGWDESAFSVFLASKDQVVTEN